MTLVAGTLRNASGERLELGEVLGRGGEARVHAVRGDPTLAAKVYAVPDAERARKLAAMIERTPADPDRRAGHVSIAWPRELVLDDEGRVAGFVMPRIDDRRYLPLHQLYHPGTRRRRAPGISWRYLVRIARNLCGAIAALHDADYVVGDLNESNILVDDRALVTLVDLDSIQVTSGFRTFRCTVGKGEYTPPELQGRSFRETNRKQSSDRFGLAILVFMLLMEGNHPFAGSFRGAGDPPSLEENIRSRRSPYFGRGKLEPPLAAPPVELLGPPLSALLRRSLLGKPWRRPDARELKDALKELEEELEQCDRSPAHAFAGHLQGCPWCERAALLGSDPYPGGRTARNGAVAASSTRHGRATPAVSGVTAAAAVAPGGRTAPNGQGGWPAVGNGGATRGGALPLGRAGVAGIPRTGRNPIPGPAAGRNGNTPAKQTPLRQNGHPRPPAPQGFRGSWAQFVARLPLLSLVLLAVPAVPAGLWQAQIRDRLTLVASDAAGQFAALALLVLLPTLVLSALLYRRARRASEFARALLNLERVARAAVAAALMSLLASLGAGLLLGRGSVLAGDWLLLPSFWIVAFVVSLRFVGPRRL